MSFSPSALATIKLTLFHADDLAKSWNFAEYTYGKFGSTFLKSNGFSPDAVLQQMFQLAYRRLHSKSVSQYCVAATMAFKAGRNDRVRSNTIECKAFVDAVMEGEAKHNLKEVSERSERALMKTRNIYEPLN